MNDDEIIAALSGAVGFRGRDVMRRSSVPGSHRRGCGLQDD
jgi:hypothetical protein